MQQVLWIETILKGTAGVLLFLLPGLVCRVFGLPHGANVFWARITGALLVGIGAAVYVDGAWPAARGLGLGGLAALNLTAAALVLSLSTLGRAAETARGTVALVVLAVALVLLALIEVVMIRA